MSEGKCPFSQFADYCDPACELWLHKGDGDRVKGCSWKIIAISLMEIAKALCDRPEKPQQKVTEVKEESTAPKPRGKELVL